jgi:hypothetical protein
VAKKIQTRSPNSERVLRKLRSKTRHFPPASVMLLAQYAALSGRQAARQRYRGELQLARTQIACVTYLAITLWGDGSGCGLSPSDWLGLDNAPPADAVLATQLCELANYNLSIVELVERGLVGPARSLTRASAELCSLITVLAGDQALFRRYVSRTEDPDKLWHELFAKGGLARRLEEAERASGVPEDLIAAFREYRRGNSKVLSQSIHHSFSGIVSGAIAQSRRGNVRLRMLGGPAQSAEGALAYLLHSTQMCITSIFGATMNMWRLGGEVRDSGLFLAAGRCFGNSAIRYSRWLGRQAATPSRDRLSPTRVPSEGTD